MRIFIIYPLLLLFFSPPLKKPKRYLPLPLFPPVFVLLFFLLSQKTLPTTMDNKSEILEQKSNREQRSLLRVRTRNRGENVEIKAREYLHA